jgi:hypothetical protein
VYNSNKKWEDMTDVIKHSKSVLSRLAYLICFNVLDCTRKSNNALNNTIIGVRIYRVHTYLVKYIRFWNIF